MRRIAVALASVGLILAMSAPTVGHAADGAVTAAGLQFVPGTIVLPQGSGLILANADPVAAAFGNGHNLTHNVPSNRRFSSRTIAIGETATVTGVAALGVGVYPIVCTVHPTLMTGTLRVV